MKLVRWSPSDLLNRLDDVIRVYGAAMDYPQSLLQTRRGYIATHAYHTAFNAVATLEEPSGQLLGFGYGYRSEQGHWWHDQVRYAIRHDDRAAWLNSCFEVVELHVHPAAQGHGIGREQLKALLAPVVETRTLLSTPEAPEDTSRAWRLYRKFGFVDVLRNFRFPGDERPFAVLGRPLPLEPRTGANSQVSTRH